MVETAIVPLRWGAVAHYFGVVLILIGPVSALPAIFGVWDGTALPYLVGAAVTTVAGFLLVRAGAEGMGFREAMAVAALTFIYPAILLGTEIWCLGYPAIDSLFEGVSAITTTGLSTFSPDEIPMSVHFARALYQWVGGIGFAVFVILFLTKPGTAAHRLLSVHISDKVSPTARKSVMMLTTIYAGITAASASLYLLSGEPPFDALIHALTTASTGGFSTHTLLPPGMVPAAIVMMSVSAQSYATYYRALRRRSVSVLLGDYQLVSFVAITAVSALVLLISGWGISVNDALLVASSAASTTGYSSVDISGASDSAKLLVSVVMLVGASLGSTGGGFKQLRLIIVLKGLKRSVLRHLLPKHAVKPVRLGGQALDEEEIGFAMALVLIYVIIVLVSTMAFTLYGYGLADSLFEASSALATTGLSAGLTSPTLPGLLKAVLMVDMMLGRLEVFPYLALLHPRNYLRR